MSKLFSWWITRRHRPLEEYLREKGWMDVLPCCALVTWSNVPVYLHLLPLKLVCTRHVAFSSVLINLFRRGRTFQPRAIWITRVALNSDCFARRFYVADDAIVPVCEIQRYPQCRNLLIEAVVFCEEGIRIWKLSFDWKSNFFFLKKLKLKERNFFI